MLFIGLISALCFSFTSITSYADTIDTKSPQADSSVNSKSSLTLDQLLPSTASLIQRQLAADRKKRPVFYIDTKLGPEFNYYRKHLTEKIQEHWAVAEKDPRYDSHTEDELRVEYTITLNANGELENVEITKKSKIENLNASLIKAVHTAAPFRPLPKVWNLTSGSIRMRAELIKKD